MDTPELECVKDGAHVLDSPARVSVSRQDGTHQRGLIGPAALLDSIRTADPHVSPLPGPVPEDDGQSKPAVFLAALGRLQPPEHGSAGRPGDIEGETPALPAGQHPYPRPRMVGRAPEPGRSMDEGAMISLQHGRLHAVVPQQVLSHKLRVGEQPRHRPTPPWRLQPKLVILSYPGVRGTIQSVPWTAPT